MLYETQVNFHFVLTVKDYCLSTDSFSVSMLKIVSLEKADTETFSVDAGLLADKVGFYDDPENFINLSFRLTNAKAEVIKANAI